MSEKLGRNPFNKGSPNRRSAKPSPADAAGGKTEAASRPKKGATTGPFLRSAVLRALSWRVESFSFWNYTRREGGGSFSFFCAGLRNHRREQPSPREIRLTLTRRRPLELSLVSLRIRSA